MTQEIGFIEGGGDIDFAKFPVGSVLFLLPYHACATAAQYPVGIRCWLDRMALRRRKILCAVW